MDDQVKIAAYASKKANKTTIWLLFLFFGWSYGSLGKMGIQILFWITLGGFGIWQLIRLFTLNGAIDEYNREVARSVGLDEKTIATIV